MFQFANIIPNLDQERNDSLSTLRVLLFAVFAVEHLSVAAVLSDGPLSHSKTSNDVENNAY
jgi:hypothetical protein